MPKSPYSSRFLAVRYKESSNLRAISGSLRIHSGGASGFLACNKLTLEIIFSFLLNSLIVSLTFSQSFSVEVEDLFLIAMGGMRPAERYYLAFSAFFVALVVLDLQRL